jgi:hypothetical protein
MRAIYIAAAAAALSLAGTAQAFEVFTDYTPTKEVWNVTMVRVNPNRVDDYLEGLKQTWWNGCEIGKKHGTVLECAIYLSENAADRDFNMMLVMKFPSAATTDPDAELYKKIQADVRASLDEAKETQLVEGYEELRDFWGQMSFRRLDFK